MQDRCTFCAKSTLGIAIVLGALKGLLIDVGEMVGLFSSFGDSVNLDA
jgi:hypothetical protein